MNDSLLLSIYNIELRQAEYKQRKNREGFTVQNFHDMIYFNVFPELVS